MVTAFHGVNAYSGRATINGLIDKARNAELSGPAEICCADRPVGTVGVLLHGHCQKFYTADAYTEPERDGSRFVATEHYSRATDYDRAWFREMTGTDAPVYDARYISGKPTTGRYKEILLRDTTACAVWYSSDQQEKTARVIGKALGLPVIQVYRDSSFLSWQI